MNNRQILITIALLTMTNLGAMNPYEMSPYGRRKYLENQKKFRQLSPSEELDYQQARQEIISNMFSKNSTPAQKSHNMQPNDTHPSPEENE